MVLILCKREIPEHIKCISNLIYRPLQKKTKTSSSNELLETYWRKNRK
jgi:hypothetical protein